MKRYALFAGREYYAGGGWNDFVGTYDTQALAQRTGERIERQDAAHDPWWHVIDLESGAILCRGDWAAHGADTPLPHVEEERARINV